MNRLSEPVLPRLNRFLARAGLGSRRSVEDLILAGRVRVDGVVTAELGRRIDPARDEVTVDGVRVSWPARWRVFAFHKPVGVVSSLRPQGRTPCLDVYASGQGLPSGAVPVGRLDADSSGLLLWTDDGELHQALCRPRSEVWKTYEVELAGPLGDDALPRLCNGEISLDGHPCLPARLTPRDREGRRWSMSLREGRNRQVRRMFSAVGAKVVALHRTFVGDIGLGKLPEGEFRELSESETASLAAGAGLRG